MYITTSCSITIITSQSKLPNRDITCKDVNICLQIITIVIGRTLSPTIVITLISTTMTITITIIVVANYCCCCCCRRRRHHHHYYYKEINKSPTYSTSAVSGTSSEDSDIA